MLAVEKHTGTMDPGGSSSDNSAVEDGRAIMIDVYAAVQNNDEVAIKQYAESGGDLEARDKDALTPLHVAAAGGYSNVVEFLTKKGCRVDCASKIGHTPLHLACRFGHLPVVLLLLANHAELNSRDKDDNTPLHKAASNGKALLCRELVKRGADIDARNDTGYTPLHWACFKGHKAAGEQLLKCGANINATSCRRATALFMSAYYGHVDVTLLLLAWGADSTISNEDGVKPGDNFYSEVPHSHKTQTRRLFVERQALLMKGYEATRRNMALMYMRSERSDLHLQHSQGEVEALWDKLAKREKELNMSKIGARDLSHVVKEMKSALEKTRQEAKTMRRKIAALEAEVERAQAAFHASRDENQELRNRAEKVEHIIAEVAARTGDDGRDKMSPRSIATVGLSVSSSRSALESGTREILAGQWGLEAQGKGESTEEHELTPADAAASVLKRTSSSTGENSAGRGGGTDGEEGGGGEGVVVALRRREESRAQELRRSNFSSAENGLQEAQDSMDKKLPLRMQFQTPSKRRPSRLATPPPSPLSNTPDRNGDLGLVYMRGRVLAASPNMAIGICGRSRGFGQSGGGKATDSRSEKGQAGSVSPALVPYLPPGSVAAQASAINSRVAELGKPVVVPLPLPQPPLEKFDLAHSAPRTVKSTSHGRSSSSSSNSDNIGNGNNDGRLNCGSRGRGTSLDSASVTDQCRTPSRIMRRTTTSPSTLRASGASDASINSSSTSSTSSTGINTNSMVATASKEERAVTSPAAEEGQNGNGGFSMATVAHLIYLGKQAVGGVLSDRRADETMPPSPENIDSLPIGASAGSDGR